MTTTRCHSDLNCGIKRWVIDAPGSSQYEECAEGEWCEWDDVSAALMRLDGEHSARERVYIDTNAAQAARIRELEAQGALMFRSLQAACAEPLASTWRRRSERLAEQKLADANALLRRWQAKFEPMPEVAPLSESELSRDTRAHVCKSCGQPAAPGRTEAEPKSADEREEDAQAFGFGDYASMVRLLARRGYSLSPRTEAEQAGALHD